MTTESDQFQWTVDGLLDLFDVQPDGTDRFTGETGIAGADERQVVEGTQVLAQAIVAVAKRFPDKSMRSAYAVFAARSWSAPPVELTIDVVARRPLDGHRGGHRDAERQALHHRHGARRRAVRRRHPPPPAQARRGRARGGQRLARCR